MRQVRNLLTLFLISAVLLGCTARKQQDKDLLIRYRANVEDVLNRQKDARDRASGQSVVKTARSAIGTPYVRGGRNPGGFDCSGLIWWAYRQNGLKVPRVTVDQARAGYAVPKSSPRPGDIMVFRTSSGPRGLHTGIYAGNNTFIHSPSRGKTVRRENMQPYWGNRLIAVRRIVI